MVAVEADLTIGDEGPTPSTAVGDEVEVMMLVSRSPLSFLAKQCKTSSFLFFCVCRVQVKRSVEAAA